MNSKPTIGTVVKVEMSGNRYNAWDSEGNKLTPHIRTGTRKSAFNAGMALECREGKGGRIYWWKVPMEQFGATSHVPTASSDVEVPEGHEEIVEFITNSYGLSTLSIQSSTVILAILRDFYSIKIYKSRSIFNNYRLVGFLKNYNN